MPLQSMLPSTTGLPPDFLRRAPAPFHLPRDGLRVALTEQGRPALCSVRGSPDKLQLFKRRKGNVGEPQYVPSVCMREGPDPVQLSSSDVALESRSFASRRPP